MFNSITPKKIFLLDGIGALVSAFFLGIVLVYFESFVGMPMNTLYLLAGLAVIFFIYSISCFLFFPEKWRPFLIIIAIVNTLYSILTMALMIYYFQQLTWLGLSYFVLEILILLFIIQLEIKIVMKKGN